MATKYAQGKRAWGICQRCSLRALLNELVFDGRIPNMRVHPGCWEPKDPLDYLPRLEDPLALWRPSPEEGPIPPVLSGVTIDNDGEPQNQLTWTPGDHTWHARFETYTLFRAVSTDDGVTFSDFTLVFTGTVLFDIFMAITFLPASYDDDAVTSGTIYRYYVVAADANHHGVRSNMVDLEPEEEVEVPDEPDEIDVILLVHGDGTNGQDTFFDTSSELHEITNSGASLFVSTSTPKFGTGSISFQSLDFADALYVTENDASADGEFDFSTRDFTVEAWVYLNPISSLNTRVIFFIDGGTPSGAPVILYLNPDFTLHFSGEANGGAEVFSIADATPLPAATWVHVAGVRLGSTYRLYKNGVLVGTDTSATALAFAVGKTVKIGNDETFNNQWTGNLDDVRVSHGAIYTANFTPPVAAFPDGE